MLQHINDHDTATHIHGMSFLIQCTRCIDCTAQIPPSLTPSLQPISPTSTLPSNMWWILLWSSIPAIQGSPLGYGHHCLLSSTPSRKHTLPWWCWHWFLSTRAIYMIYVGASHTVPTCIQWFLWHRIHTTAQGHNELSIIKRLCISCITGKQVGCAARCVGHGGSWPAQTHALSWTVTGLPQPDFSFMYKPLLTMLFCFLALTFNGHHILRILCSTVRVIQVHYLKLVDKEN